MGAAIGRSGRGGTRAVRAAPRFRAWCAGRVCACSVSSRCGVVRAGSLIHQHKVLHRKDRKRQAEYAPPCRARRKTSFLALGPPGRANGGDRRHWLNKLVWSVRLGGKKLSAGRRRRAGAGCARIRVRPAADPPTRGRGNNARVPPRAGHRAGWRESAPRSRTNSASAGAQLTHLRDKEAGYRTAKEQRHAGTAPERQPPAGTTTRQEEQPGRVFAPTPGGRLGRRWAEAAFASQAWWVEGRSRLLGMGPQHTRPEPADRTAKRAAESAQASVERQGMGKGSRRGPDPAVAEGRHSPAEPVGGSATRRPGWFVGCPCHRPQETTTVRGTLPGFCGLPAPDSQWAIDQVD